MNKTEKVPIWYKNKIILFSYLGNLYSNFALMPGCKSFTFSKLVVLLVSFIMPVGRGERRLYCYPDLERPNSSFVKVYYVSNTFLLLNL